LSRAFEQTLTVDVVHDKIDDAERAAPLAVDQARHRALRAGKAAPVRQGMSTAAPYRGALAQIGEHFERVGWVERSETRRLT
jgi:hypothetical protein